MNTPIDDGNTHLRYAEYVLGVLDADTRAAVAHEVETSDEAAVAVALWQRRLMPLTDLIQGVTPGPYVWARIQDALKFDAPVKAKPRAGLWNNLQLWQWFGLSASALAVALLVVVSLPHPTAPQAVVSEAYLAATIQQDNGTTGWTATMDVQHGRIIVVPASPIAFAPGHAPELWLIPPGGKPISVGMIAINQPTTLAIAPDTLAKIASSALLAVSVEPLGGSPTGQPTGAVIGKGAIGHAPDTKTKVVSVKAHTSDRTSV